MGVMFGLAGTLMARSLRRPAPTVLRSRLRRLLPPFWCWGLLVVGAMLVRGWMTGWQIVCRVVPLGDPPGSAWGEQAWEILWYLRTYLGFVLLSLLPRLFRLAPVPVLLLSLVPIVVLQFLWQPPGNRFGTGLLDLAAYLFCWIPGFAHHDGVLARARPLAVVALSSAAPRGPARAGCGRVPDAADVRQGAARHRLPGAGPDAAAGPAGERVQRARRPSTSGTSWPSSWPSR